MDISCLCRGCMQELHSNKSENCDKMISKMFSFCTKIEISEDNDLPQRFCSDCLKCIESSYRFIIKAVQVQKKFEMLNVKCSDEKIQPELEICSDSETDPLMVLVKKETKEVEIVHDTESFCKDDVEQTMSLNKVYEERKNICTICNKDFKFEGWLKKHVVKEHSGHTTPGKYNCNYCSRSYTRQINYTKHIQRHMEKVKVYSCDECEKGFTSKALLNSHSITHMKKEFECNDCGNRFKTKFTLRTHIETNHGKNAKDKFLCAFCGTGFKKAAVLEEHLRIHTGARPFPCDQCKMEFRTYSSLYRHRQRHTGVKGKECRQCSKRFYTNGELERHSRSHSGQRPYRCGQCTRAFAASWHRKAHLMRAHRRALADIPRLDRAGRPLQP